MFNYSRAIYLTKKDCQKAERQAVLDIENISSEVSLLEVCTHRFDYLELSRNQEYFKDQKRLSKKLLSAFGNISVTEINSKMSSDLFLEEIKRCKLEGLGNKRPNELLKTLRTTINYAINNFDVVMRDPTRGIKRLPEDTNVPFIPTEEMIKKIILSCNHLQKPLVQFVYETGCRIGEAVALKSEDVNHEYVTLYTRKSRNSQLTPRHVPRPKWLSVGGNGDVFKFSAYPRFLEEKIKELKQPHWRWHGLRRRRASIWAEKKPLFEIMMLLGHSQISTTQRYLFSLGVIKL